MMTASAPSIVMKPRGIVKTSSQVDYYSQDTVDTTHLQHVAAVAARRALTQDGDYLVLALVGLPGAWKVIHRSQIKIILGLERPGMPGVQRRPATPSGERRFVGEEPTVPPQPRGLF